MRGLFPTKKRKRKGGEKEAREEKWKREERRKRGEKEEKEEKRGDKKGKKEGKREKRKKKQLQLQFPLNFYGFPFIFTFSSKFLEPSLSGEAGLYLAQLGHHLQLVGSRWSCPGWGCGGCLGSCY